MNTFGCKDTFFLCNFQEKYEKSAMLPFWMIALHFRVMFLFDYFICLYLAILVTNLSDVDTW